MLLQTNSYVVPKDKRTEHARLVKRFRQVMARLGLTDLEVYEQSGANWSNEVGGRFVQIMRFRDREHQQAVQAAEKADGGAQDLVREFCELVNFHYQHQQGIATTAFYIGVNPPAPSTGGQRRLSGGTQAAATNGEAIEAEEGDELDAGHPEARTPFPQGSPIRTSGTGDAE